jgi:hypothetical protein
MMTFADEVASSPSRRSNVGLFSSTKRGLSVVAPTIVPASMIAPFYRRGRPASQHESYFVGRCLPKAVATSFLFMRAFGLPRSLRFCSSVPSPIIPGCMTLACFLVSPGVVILFVISNTPCAGRFFGMGGTPFVRKTRLVRKVMTVQNCSMKGLPMRRALTTGVVRRANICGSACHATSMKNPAHRRRSGASYFAQSLDGHGRTL